MNSNDRSIVGLVMLAHAMVHTYELSIPIFVAIWLDNFGVSEGIISIVVTAGYALFGIGALPGGVMADRYGSRTLIIGCLAGMAGSFLVLSVAPTIPVIAFALILWGVAASVYHPSGLSLISKGVTKRGTAFAYHGMAGNLGIAFGPLVTTVLLLVFDWRMVAALLAIPAMIAATYAFTVSFDETAAVKTTDGGTDGRAEGGVDSFAEFIAESRLLFTSGFLAVFAIVILSGLYYRGTLTFLPSILQDFALFDQPIDITAVAATVVASLGLEGTSLHQSLIQQTYTVELANYYYAGLLMIGVLGQYTGGKLTDRMRTEHGISLAFAGLAVLAVAFIPASNAGLLPFIVVGALLGFSLFVVQPFYQATVAEYTPAESRGLSYGYTYLGVFGVGAGGATIAGFVLGLANATVLFMVLAAFAAVASLLGAWLLRRS